ncbi:MAG: hypothetical protein WCV79_01780 [Candidatus Paceibacterota bacterium]|jgi:hypothetical protein
MFFSEKKEDRVILLISVQSSMVRGTLVRDRAGELPLVMWSSSKAIRHREDADASYLPKATFTHVRNLSEEIARDYEAYRHSDPSLPAYIEEVHYALASPWILSHALTLSKKYDNAVPVSEKMILTIISDARSKFLPKDAKELAIVEEKIFDIRLNGYSISSWQGKTAHSLEISFATSAIEIKTEEKFREACGHIVRGNNIFFHSSLLLHHIGLQHIFPEKVSYVLVHVHGELTDVVVVENRMCTFFGSFPMGINTAIRQIALSANVTEQVADSMLTMYIGGRMDTAEKEKTRVIIETISAEWNAQFANLTGGYLSDEHLPETAILTSRSHEAFFVESYKKHFEKSKVELISTEMLSGFISFAPKVEKLRLTGLYSIALTILHKRL